MEQHNFDPGTAGASARREYERRRAKRQEETRRRHPRVGNLLLKVQQPPSDEVAWATGAAGEESLAISLARRCPQALFLHDRRMPRSRANIDHIGISTSGVYVIDAKRYKGRIEVRRPLFGQEQLRIGGRDKTKLVDGLTRQVDAVRASLDSKAFGVPVHGCFCFVNPQGQSGGTALPLFRTLRIRQYPLLFPRKLAKLLKQPGPLEVEQLHRIAAALAEQFPPA